MAWNNSRMTKRGCLCTLPCTSSLDFFFRELKANYQLGHLMKLQFLLTEYGITFKRFATYMTAKYKMPCRRRSRAITNLKSTVIYLQCLDIPARVLCGSSDQRGFSKCSENLLDPLRIHTNDSVTRPFFPFSTSAVGFDSAQASERR